MKFHPLKFHEAAITWSRDQLRPLSRGKIDEKLVIGGAEKKSASEVLEVEGIRGHW